MKAVSCQEPASFCGPLGNALPAGVFGEEAGTLQADLGALFLRETAQGESQKGTDHNDGLSPHNTNLLFSLGPWLCTHRPPVRRARRLHRTGGPEVHSPGESVTSAFAITDGGSHEIGCLVAGGPSI